MSDDSSGLVKLMAVLTVVLVFVTVSLFSYSASGYTFVKYPGVKGEAVVCVDGDVDPSNESITVYNDGASPTDRPYVTINGVRHEFNQSVGDTALRQRTDALRLGCNTVEYGAQSDSRFKVRLEYASHWRPVVSSLEIGSLMAGHNTRYFIATPDADTRKIVRGRLNITDISRDIDVDLLPRYDLEFNGSAVRYKLDQPGNYRVGMQVYDGYSWSDIYEAGFTIHVISTDEHKKVYVASELPDQPLIGYDGYVPAAIGPKDNDALKMAKKALDGGYMLVKRVLDYCRGTYIGLAG